MIRITAFLIAFFILPTTAAALCVSQTSQSENQACINLGGGFACVQFADLEPGGGEKQAAQLQSVLQSMIDFKQTLSSIPVDDPDKTIDPDDPRLFHGDANGDKTVATLEKDHLVSRCADVAVVFNKVTKAFRIMYSRP